MVKFESCFYLHVLTYVKTLVLYYLNNLLTFSFAPVDASV